MILTGLDWFDWYRNELAYGSSEGYRRFLYGLGLIFDTQHIDAASQPVNKRRLNQCSYQYSKVTGKLLKGG